MDDRDKKVFAAVVAALAIAVIALILLLPHRPHSVATTTVPQYNATNLTNFNSSQGYKPPVSSTTVSSTTTVSGSSSPNSTTTVQTTTTATTTVDYTYCVGSDYYPFNQSYYTAFEPGITYYGPTSGKWTATQPYPIASIGASCAVYNGYIYCVGGSFNGIATSAAYYANVTINGIGQWFPTTGYPVPFSGAGCSAYDGYLYCVGNANLTHESATYYAGISSGGIGAWHQGSSYPANISGPSCSAYDGYLYCVGGINTTNPALRYIQASPPSYYSAVSPSGIGPWHETSTYPVKLYNNSCSAYDGYLYCVGGSAEFAAFASLNFSGMSASQVLQNVTGLINTTISRYSNTTAVYYAKLSQRGIGAWNSTYPYPVPITDSGCVVSSGPYLYCIGSSTYGHGSDVYYTQLVTNGTYNPGYGPQAYYNVSVNATSHTQNVTFVQPNATENTIVSVKPGSITLWTKSYSYPIQFYYGSCASTNSSGGYYS